MPSVRMRSKMRDIKIGPRPPRIPNIYTTGSNHLSFQKNGRDGTLRRPLNFISASLAFALDSATQTHCSSLLCSTMPAMDALCGNAWLQLRGQKRPARNRAPSFPPASEQRFRAEVVLPPAVSPGPGPYVQPSIFSPNIFVVEARLRGCTHERFVNRRGDLQVAIDRAVSEFDLESTQPFAVTDCRERS